MCGRYAAILPAEFMATLFQTDAITVQDVPSKGRTGKAYKLVK